MLQEPEGRERSSESFRYVLRERGTFTVIALFISVTLAHFVRERWWTLDHQQVPSQVIAKSDTTAALSTLYAPNAYRVGMPWLGSLFSGLHVEKSTIAGLLDGLFCLITLLFLYAILMDPVPTSRPQRPTRMVYTFAILSASQLVLNWVVPWQRPETMASCCFFGAAVYCTDRTHKWSGWTVGAVLLIVTVWQSLVRSDVALAFGLGLLIASLLATKVSVPVELRRRSTLMALLMVATSASVQLYLQMIAFPHLGYPPGTPKYQWRWNLTIGHNLEILGLAIGPFIAIVLAGSKFARQIRLLWSDLVILSGATIHFVLWFVLGSTQEVRIFVPSMLLLCVPAVRILAQILFLNTETSKHSLA